MGKEYQSNVIVANEYTLLGTGSLYNEITFGTTATEIKVGTTKLSGRTVVTMCAHPDNSGYIYVGLDNTVSPTKYLYVLTGGAAASFKINTADNPTLYAVGSVMGQRCGVCEVKSGGG